MSILIKGVEMPESCSVCPMLEGDRMDGLCHAASKWLDDDEHWTWYVYPEGDMDDSKPCNCPLVPVPERGGLCNKDDVLKVIDNLIGRTANEEAHEVLKWAKDCLSVLPTIIPAKEGEG